MRTVLELSLFCTNKIPKKKNHKQLVHIIFMGAFFNSENTVLLNISPSQNTAVYLYSIQ